MSDQPKNSGSEPPDERTVAQQLRLRPERPRVTRLSRKVLVGFGAAGSVAMFGATIWALQPNRRSGAGEELYSTDNRTTADGLANLPRDYTGLPRNVPPLGPPLPGDLGRPIVAAQANGQPVTVPSMPTAPVDQEEQRRLQEREAARLSKLFAGTSVREQAATLLPSVTTDGTGPTAPVAGPSIGGGQETGAGADVRQNGQDGKLAFVNAVTDKRTVSPDRLQAPASPLCRAGRDPYSRRTAHRHSVRPAGADHRPSHRKRLRQPNRALPAYPAGREADRDLRQPGHVRAIPRAPGLDPAHHAEWSLRRARTAARHGPARLFRAGRRCRQPLGPAVQGGLAIDLAQRWIRGRDNRPTERPHPSHRQGASNSFSQTGQQIVGRQLNIQPTLTIRPGFPVRVFVYHDLVLAPYRS